MNIQCQQRHCDFDIIPERCSDFEFLERFCFLCGEFPVENKLCARGASIRIVICERNSGNYVANVCKAGMRLAVAKCELMRIAHTEHEHDTIAYCAVEARLRPKKHLHQGN